VKRNHLPQFLIVANGTKDRLTVAPGERLLPENLVSRIGRLQEKVEFAFVSSCRHQEKGINLDRSEAAKTVTVNV
jgi:hypothetical protein